MTYQHTVSIAIVLSWEVMLKQRLLGSWGEWDRGGLELEQQCETSSL